MHLGIDSDTPGLIPLLELNVLFLYKCINQHPSWLYQRKRASPVSATASVRNTYPAALAGAVVVAGTSAGAGAGAAFVGAVARHFDISM